MKLNSKVAALEKAAGTADKALCCTVDFKAGRGPREKRMSRAAAIEAIQRGEVQAVQFDLSFAEEQAERRRGNILDVLYEEIQGVRRDDGSQAPGASHSLVLCTKPVIFARQAPPSGCPPVGGNFITEDGEAFHQSQWKELLERRGAGFIIVLEYDESKEPWYQER